MSCGPIIDYYPPGEPPCDLDAPLAEDSPWQVFDNETDRNPLPPGGVGGLYAEKTVGSVVIRAEIRDGQPGTNARFNQPDPATAGDISGGGMPQGARDPNALSVQQDQIGGNSVAGLRFSVSVPQPGFRIRVIDLDQQQGGGQGEALRVEGSTGAATQPAMTDFGPTNVGEASSVVPFQAGPFGNPNADVSYVNGGATGTGYRGKVNEGENSALLFYPDRPWGDGANGADPLVVAWILSPQGAGGQSQYDFGGPIQQQVCAARPRQARLVCCGGESRWLDTVTGEDICRSPLLVNGSFEDPVIADGFTFVPEGSMPGWEAEAGGTIETWRNFNAHNNPQLLPYPSDQVIEILGEAGSTGTFQVVNTPPEAMTLEWAYMHARRFGQGIAGGAPTGTETAILQLGDAADPPASLEVVDTFARPPGDNAWRRRTGTWAKPAGVTQVRMRFTGTNTEPGAGQGGGNLIDEVQLTGDCL